MTVQPTDHELLSHVCWCERCCCIKPQRYVAIFQHSPPSSPQISLHTSVFAPLDKGNCCCLSYFLKTEMNSRPFKLFSCRFVSHYESTLQNIRSSTLLHTYLLLPLSTSSGEFKRNIPLVSSMVYKAHDVVNLVSFFI